MIGKKIGYNYYIHLSAVDELPENYKDMYNKFMSISNNRVLVYSCNKHNCILKLNLNKQQISILHYVDFYHLAHPWLEFSVCANVNGEYRCAVYRNNHPILHRKELLIKTNNPAYGVFKELSEQENKAGLLGRNDIGRKSSWDKILKKKGYIIEDHQLIKIGK